MQGMSWYKKQSIKGTEQLIVAQSPERYYYTDTMDMTKDKKVKGKSPIS